MAVEAIRALGQNPTGEELRRCGVLGLSTLLILTHIQLTRRKLWTLCLVKASASHIMLA